MPSSGIIPFLVGELLFIIISWYVYSEMFINILSSEYIFFTPTMLENFPEHGIQS
jgi:hypothetical protein